MSKIGKSKIVRVIEELKYKMLSLVTNKTGRNNKEFSAEKDSDKYEIN